MSKGKKFLILETSDVWQYTDGMVEPEANVKATNKVSDNQKDQRRAPADSNMVERGQCIECIMRNAVTATLKLTHSGRLNQCTAARTSAMWS